ncbi:MAG: hypothetical protein MHM6MM_005387 [Cercozoa sp. M6MM]
MQASSGCAPCAQPCAQWGTGFPVIPDVNVPCTTPKLKWYDYFTRWLRTECGVVTFVLLLIGGLFAALVMSGVALQRIEDLNGRIDALQLQLSAPDVPAPTATATPTPTLTPWCVTPLTQSSSLPNTFDFDNATNNFLASGVSSSQRWTTQATSSASQTLTGDGSAATDVVQFAARLSSTGDSSTGFAEFLSPPLTVNANAQCTATATSIAWSVPQDAFDGFDLLWRCCNGVERTLLSVQTATAPPTTTSGTLPLNAVASRTCGDSQSNLQLIVRFRRDRGTVLGSNTASLTVTDLALSCN